MFLSRIHKLIYVARHTVVLILLNFDLVIKFLAIIANTTVTCWCNVCSYGQKIILEWQIHLNNYYTYFRLHIASLSDKIVFSNYNCRQAKTNKAFAIPSWKNVRHDDVLVVKSICTKLMFSGHLNILLGKFTSLFYIITYCFYNLHVTDTITHI